MTFLQNQHRTRVCPTYLGHLDGIHEVVRVARSQRRQRVLHPGPLRRGRLVLVPNGERLYLEPDHPSRWLLSKRGFRRQHVKQKNSLISSTVDVTGRLPSHAERSDVDSCPRGTFSLMHAFHSQSPPTKNVETEICKKPMKLHHLLFKHDHVAGGVF